MSTIQNFLGSRFLQSLLHFFPILWFSCISINLPPLFIMLNFLLKLLFKIINGFLSNISQQIQTPCTLANLFTNFFILAWRGLDIVTSITIMLITPIWV